MSYLAATFESMWTSFRQALRKPTTVNTPFEQRARAPRIRASFALTHDEHGEENCIGCKKCEHVCPSDIISVLAAKRTSPVTGKARGYADDFTLNLQACIICELCVQVCPTDAIIMTQEQEVPGFSREDLTLTMDKLYANEHKKRWAWSNATVLGEHQDPARGKPPPKPKADARPAAEPKPKADAKPAAEPKPKADAKPAAEPKPKADAKPAAEPASSAEGTDSPQRDSTAASAGKDA